MRIVVPVVVRRVYAVWLLVMSVLRTVTAVQITVVRTINALLIWMMRFYAPLPFPIEVCDRDFVQHIKSVMQRTALSMILTFQELGFLVVLLK
jgi:hypothetical protein